MHILLVRRLITHISSQPNPLMPRVHLKNLTLNACLHQINQRHLFTNIRRVLSRFLHLYMHTFPMVSLPSLPDLVSRMIHQPMTLIPHSPHLRAIISHSQMLRARPLNIIYRIQRLPLRNRFKAIRPSRNRTLLPMLHVPIHSMKRNTLTISTQMHPRISRRRPPTRIRRFR